MCPNRTEKQRLRPEWICPVVGYNGQVPYEEGVEETRMRMLVTVTLGILLLASESARAQGVVLPLPPEDQQNITAQLGAGVVGAALASSPTNDPSAYYPLQQQCELLHSF